jgi:modulator of FtsH protease HflC
MMSLNMNQKYDLKFIVPIGAVLFSLIILSNSIFIVREDKQAVVRQFKKIIGQPKTKAGLYFKIPFIQDVRYLEKRILSWDSRSAKVEGIPTRDKRVVNVQVTSRWQIFDAMKFISEGRNLENARRILGGILNAATKNSISTYNLVEAIRTTNDLIKDQKVSEKNKDRDKGIITKIEKIKVGRNELSKKVAIQASKKLASYGIKIIDVQLKRISFEKNVEEKVFERMISEYQSIAEKYRAEGKGEKAKIEGNLDRDLKLIESTAYRKSQEIKGRAEAKSIKIYAGSLNRNPKFYDFIRSLESYSKSINEKSEVILSTNSEYFKFLK